MLSAGRAYGLHSAIVAVAYSCPARHGARGAQQGQFAAQANGAKRDAEFGHLTTGVLRNINGRNEAPGALIFLRKRSSSAAKDWLKASGSRSKASRRLTASTRARDVHRRAHHHR